MKTIFDKSTRDELIKRINSLTNKSTAQWGKMNVYQMIKHCSSWEEMIQENKLYKQAFVGRIFGKMALKSVLKNDAPLRKNTPTLPELIMSGDGDVEEEKQKWVSRINNYSNYSTPYFLHPFFGKMTKEQIGFMVYKHEDHHLRQFGA
ncbi:MAG: DUF1569 domain-containing protein [Ginsengibacter sp.]